MDAKSCVLRRLLTYLMRKLGQSRESCWPTKCSSASWCWRESKNTLFCHKIPPNMLKGWNIPWSVRRGWIYLCQERETYEKANDWKTHRKMFQMKHQKNLCDGNCFRFLFVRRIICVNQAEWLIILPYGALTSDFLGHFFGGWKRGMDALEASIP